MGAISRGRFEARIRELVAGNMMLEAAAEPMLRVRAALRLELARLEKRVRQMAAEDSVCLRLMTMPGVGAVVALTFRSAIDDPKRFHSSKNVGPWVGLTPSRSQSGERDVSGGITKAGDVNLRRALCQAATVMLNRGRSNTLRTWAAPCRQTSRAEARNGRAGQTHGRRASPYVGRWHELQDGSHHLTRPVPPASLQALEVPKGRGSRDVVVRTVASLAEHANEMDTPELHRTSILSAASRLTTDRSTFPKDLEHEPRRGNRSDSPKATRKRVSFS